MTSLHVAQLASGPGRTIVASHALGLDHRMWEGWARHLEGRHTLLAFDHRGHGRSAPMAGQSMRDLCDEVAEHLHRWSRDTVVFVGLSMGGMVGQGLAIHHPQFLHALVLAHTVARYDDVARAAWAARIEAVQAGGMAAVAEVVLHRYLHAQARAADPAAVDRLRALLLNQRAVDYAACCSAVAGVDWLDDLSRVRVPTLVLAGALDVGAPPDAAMQIAQAIDVARCEVIDDASHLSPWEQSKAFARHLDHFLERYP